MCSIGEEVPNEDQSECVGKLDRNNCIILSQCVLMLNSYHLVKRHMSEMTF